jgi:hypothetical protein
MFGGNGGLRAEVHIELRGRSCRSELWDFGGEADVGEDFGDGDGGKDGREGVEFAAAAVANNEVLTEGSGEQVRPLSSVGGTSFGFVIWRSNWEGHAGGHWRLLFGGG